MKLRKLILENFRGYKNLEVPLNENLNVIIGKNDIGKSTILEALEIFFNNNNSVKIEIQDLNVWATKKEITIGITLEVDKTKDYLIDSENKTNLEDEFLLNKNGELQILKVWDCSKSLTAKSLSTYLVANYPTAFDANPLVTVKITDLKKIVKEKEIEDAVEDKRISSKYRKAIYQVSNTEEKKEILIPVDKEDAKAIWGSLNAELPFFALFQSDRQNKDSDKEVQDPLKLITKQAIATKEAELQQVINEIKAKAEEKGQKTIDKLSEMDSEIAKSLSPNVSNRNWDSLFSFSFTGDEGIPLNKRGSGVRRLILLNYFRAEAEDNTSNSRGVIYAIEEPETSQHPNYQIMLINSLITLSEAENKQVIITTHSPEIAKIAEDQNLILVVRDDDDMPRVVLDSDAKLSKIKETLGILPYLSRLVICVEGEYDIKFLKNINNIPEFKKIIDLEAEGISIIPMLGGNLKNWVDRNYLKQTNAIEFHIYDRDSNSGHNSEKYRDQCDAVNNRNDGSFAIMTKKREMENYISKEAIETQFCINCSEITDWNVHDIPKFIANKTRLKEPEVKEILNGKLASQITKDSLEKMGAYDEIKGWFEKLREMN